MIRINLLPAELRRGNRLPPRVLAAAFGAALLCSAAVGWLGLVYFGDLARAEQELETAHAQLALEHPGHIDGSAGAPLSGRRIIETHVHVATRDRRELARNHLARAQGRDLVGVGNGF